MSSASRFMYATMSSLPLSASMTTAGIRPWELNFSFSYTFLSILQPHIYAVSGQFSLQLRYGHLAEVEYARRQTGAHPRHGRKKRHQVGHAPGPARGHHGHSHPRTHRLEHFKVKAALDSVGVYAVDDHLARARRHAALYPRERLHTRVVASPARKDAELAVHTF